ncbi:hypothetical protein LTR36_002532 [Oleoguttula mirabilis]|uniref:BTB domain-containing protein n=1 Tax=Oleoguttula mirabilis TaxID=1507867 RepID=A0AAV9JKX9_9PEZI|nr:hypothetical protein LTR36_002532 [Oleoguttula mirabilis]
MELNRSRLDAALVRVAEHRHRSSSVRHGLQNIGDLYSDYTITCQSFTAKVHRIVLHTQSVFFATAFSGGFREGQPSSTAMNLPEDDPAAVEAMIEYFYNGKYTIPTCASKSGFHVKILVIADKYEAGALEDKARKLFHEACEWIWSGTNPGEIVGMVRAMAESEGVPRLEELKEVAVRAMERLLPHLLLPPMFQRLLQELPEWNLALLKRLSETAVTRHLNLRSAAAEPLDCSIGTSQVSNDIVVGGGLSISVVDACDLFGTIADGLVPAPLFAGTPDATSRGSSTATLTPREMMSAVSVPVSGGRDGQVPFPDFDDDYAADLLEPAVQVSFRKVDWTSPKHNDDENDDISITHTGNAAGSPGCSTFEFVGCSGDAFKAVTLEAVSIRGSKPALKQVDGVFVDTTHAPDNDWRDTSIRAARRNAIVPLQVSDQNGLTLGSELTPELLPVSANNTGSATYKTDTGMPVLLTMHGFAYDLRDRVQRYNVSKQGQRATHLEAVTRGLKKWLRR